MRRRGRIRIRSKQGKAREHNWLVGRRNVPAVRGKNEGNCMHVPMHVVRMYLIITERLTRLTMSLEPAPLLYMGLNTCTYVVDLFPECVA